MIPANIWIVLGLILALGTTIWKFVFNPRLNYDDFIHRRAYVTQRV